MKLICLLLLLPFSLPAQTIESERTDSIRIGNSIFPIYSLKINNYSASDPAKVFVIPAASFDSLKKKISKLYFSTKQEYNEYYVLGFSDVFEVELNEKAVIEFLHQIDSARATRNRSTFLRQYSWDGKNNKITYQSTEKELKNIDNLYYLNSTLDLCKYMVCRHK